jgi:large subunit ribosomal protein L24
MHVKKGDTVLITTGKDKGKKGSVLRVLPKENKVIVEGINIKKVHERANRGEKGKIVERSLPVHASNVKLAEAGAKAPRKTKAKATK